MQQSSDVPKSSVRVVQICNNEISVNSLWSIFYFFWFTKSSMQNHLLTKIKALYANTPKHPGEGTSSRNIHVQTSQMHHGEGSSSRNNHAQTSHMFRHDYQSTLDKLSLRDNHNDGVRKSSSLINFFFCELFFLRTWSSSLIILCMFIRLCSNKTW